MALIVVVVVVVMFVIVVAFLLVGDSLVIVVGAIALPPLRLSAVEISMGACSLYFPSCPSPFPCCIPSWSCGYCKHLLNFFVDFVSLIVTATQIACYLLPLPRPCTLEGHAEKYVKK